LTTLESAPACNLADNQEKILGPAIRRQVRLARFIIVRVVRIATGTTAMLPGCHRSPLPSLKHQPVDVALSHFAALLGTHLPVEGKRMPVPAVTSRALFSGQALAGFFQLGRRWDYSKV